MARQFRNVTAEQIAYVAQLQRSGDEAGALQAANEAATKGFDDQTRRLKENMGTLETWQTGQHGHSNPCGIRCWILVARTLPRECWRKQKRLFDEADKNGSGIRVGATGAVKPQHFLPISGEHGRTERMRNLGFQPPRCRPILKGQRDGSKGLGRV